MIKEPKINHTYEVFDCINKSWVQATLQRIKDDDLHFISDDGFAYVSENNYNVREAKVLEQGKLYFVVVRGKTELEDAIHTMKYVGWSDINDMSSAFMKMEGVNPGSPSIHYSAFKDVFPTWSDASAWLKKSRTIETILNPDEPPLMRDYDKEIRQIRSESSKRRKQIEKDSEAQKRVDNIGLKMEKAWESRKKTSLSVPEEPEVVTDWNKIGVTAAAQIGSVAVAAGAIALGATLAPLLTIPAILGLNYAWLKSKEEKL